MPGFFDTFDDEYAGAFVKKEEKDALISTKAVFTVNSVNLRIGGGYQGKGDQYVLGITLDDEPRSIGFAAGGVPSRDRMFDALAEYLATEGAEPVEVFLEKDGQSVLVRDASGEGE